MSGNDQERPPMQPDETPHTPAHAEYLAHACWLFDTLRRVVGHDLVLDIAAVAAMNEESYTAVEQRLVRMRNLYDNLPIRGSGAANHPPIRVTEHKDHFSKGRKLTQKQLKALAKREPADDSDSELKKFIKKKKKDDDDNNGPDNGKGNGGSGPDMIGGAQAVQVAT